MIGYATLGSNDIDRALAFYDALLPTLGGKQLMQLPDEQKLTFYGVDMDKPMLGVGKPYDGGSATPGNGTMVALAAGDRGQVDAVHAKAIELGGTDEGAPGLRAPEEMGFYGAYFRDLDGNKLCVFKLG
ncbi:VOC family protein [Sphingomonas sp. SUN019]|uniref:VOC family protein n=1 Tax=Sphingomonas sp. SUN019 TaxID=2937788 RepID=UPI002164DEF0|nr:VOC family protein [Sphingomonas sp. SUN019]UVO49984.1 VOC family protein [Sphingomonas sp. SUN019]